MEGDELNKAFLSILFHGSCHIQVPTTSIIAKAIDNIRNRCFFGLIECDTLVPAELRGKFAKIAPLFKNVHLVRACYQPGEKAMLMPARV